MALVYTSPYLFCYRVILHVIVVVFFSFRNSCPCLKKGGDERAKISQAVKNYKVTCLVALIRIGHLILQNKTLKNLEISFLIVG